MSKLRLGILGGTFDPIHNAHLAIAHAAIDGAHLDRVLFVVAGHPPHKMGDVCTPAEDRLAMVRAAIADEQAFAVSDIELQREGPSYTVDTLKALSQKCPDVELYLIIGGDSLKDFMKWRDPEGILARANLLVARRPDDVIPEKLTGRFTTLPFHKTALSATQIRDAVIAGADISDQVPEAVVHYIQSHGLYHESA